MRFELWCHEEEGGCTYELIGEDSHDHPWKLSNQPGARRVAVFEAPSYNDAKRQQHEFLGWEPYKPFRRT